MPDRPRPYVGQNPKTESPDEYSTWTDRSHPQEPGTNREPMDILDPDRPSGSQTCPPPPARKKYREERKRRRQERRQRHKNRSSMRWFRYEDDSK